MIFKSFFLWNDPFGRFISFNFAFIKWSIPEAFWNVRVLMKVSLGKDIWQSLILEQKKCKDGTTYWQIIVIIIQKPVRIIARSDVGEESDHLSVKLWGTENERLSDCGGGGHLPQPGPTPCTNSQVMSLGRKHSEDIERGKAETTAYLPVRVLSEWKREMRNEWRRWVRKCSRAWRQHSAHYTTPF